jgi:hypothetical protein
MSDMATIKVKNRDFQRAPAEWLHKARRGETVVILSPEGPPLTLRAGYPKRDNGYDWSAHFEWLHKQPVIEVNPVDESRRAERR